MKLKEELLFLTCQAHDVKKKMDNKKIESKIASLFMEKLLKRDISDEEIENRNPPEPDIRFNDYGIELGSLLVGGFISVDNHEKKFFDDINNRVKGMLPENYQIGLVMQDDKIGIKHSPTENTKKYKLLPKYLEAVFISIFPESLNDQQPQIYLNQKSSLRPSSGLFPETEKEVSCFIRELSDFVNQVPQAKFIPNPLGSDRKWYHETITKGEIVRSNGIDRLGEVFSDKIIEKLKTYKYEGDHKYSILLLHNFEDTNVAFSDNRHFYSHNREAVIQHLKNLCDRFETGRLYDGIYFSDFSLTGDTIQFDVVKLKGCSSLENYKI